MASHPTFLFIGFLIILSSSFVISSSDSSYDLECLTVPPMIFISTLKAAMFEVQRVTALVAKFKNTFQDFRLSNALDDCLDLLDFSSDELSWSMAATVHPYGKDNSTGNRRDDLKAWLSASLENQDTCIDGFEGIGSFVKEIIARSVNQLSFLVADVLGMVSNTRVGFGPRRGGGGGGGGGGEGGNHSEFPPWMTRKERGLLQKSAAVFVPDVVVAADGTGNYTKVMDAIKDVPNESMQRYVIYVKKGIYEENVEIKKKKWNIMMIGDGMNFTVITGNRSVIDGWSTFKSATFAVNGRGFIARDITFQNTAGPEKHQAVALRSDSDLSVFYRCGIYGYQDTLYAHSLRQFYRECKITGTVDFIFGNGAVVFQSCQILARKPLPEQKNSITAQGRKWLNQTTGFSIQFSNISADSDLFNSTNTTYTYLGRPWKEYSKTIIMQSYLGSVIRPEGWLEWQGDFALDTLYYAEYMNYGPGAGVGSRVKWPGYHILNSSADAINFTVAQFIDGNMWLPSTGVTYTSGLSI